MIRLPVTDAAAPDTIPSFNLSRLRHRLLIAAVAIAVLFLHNPIFASHLQSLLKQMDFETRKEDRRNEKPSPLFRKQRGEDTFRNSTCPWIFGLGSQKAGTTAVVYALGDVAQVLAKNDIFQLWDEMPKSDRQLLRILHKKGGLIQKEGHGIHYLQQIRRICPDTKYYVLTRGLMQNVRSIADRLGLSERSNCSDPEQFARIPPGWQPLFRYSNSSSCHIRLAHFHIYQYGRIMNFVQSLPFDVPIMRYEDFRRNQTKSTIDLCEKLDYLSCNRSVVIPYQQHQGKGRNAGTNITDLWSAELIQDLQALEQKEERDLPLMRS